MLGFSEVKISKMMTSILFWSTKEMKSLLLTNITSFLCEMVIHYIKSILHVIRRLMADKGQLSQIISDPITQFKGATNKLENTVQRIL